MLGTGIYQHTKLQSTQIGVAFAASLGLFATNSVGTPSIMFVCLFTYLLWCYLVTCHTVSAPGGCQLVSWHVLFVLGRADPVNIGFLHNQTKTSPLWASSIFRAFNVVCVQGLSTPLCLPLTFLILIEALFLWLLVWNQHIQGGCPLMIGKVQAYPLSLDVYFRA